MFVPWTDGINILDRVGPSSVHELIHGCPLKVLLSSFNNADQCPRGINLHPNAFIGTIIHKLHEAARKNNPSNNGEAWTIAFANTVLETITAQQQEAIGENPIDRHLPELRGLRSYERCVAALFSSVQINGGLPNHVAHDHSSSTTYHHRLVGAEIDVWDLECTWPANLTNQHAPSFWLKGQIDLVEVDAEGRYSIVDWKTGRYFDSLSGELNQTYVTQLKLYAQMWVQTALHRHGLEIPISELRLFLDGNEGRCEVEKDGSFELLQNARQVIQSVNEVVENQALTYAISDALANPAPTSCKYCLWRTGCNPYLSVLESEGGFLEEGFDLIGSVHSLPILNAVGSTEYQLKIQTTDGTIWLVDNIHAQWVEGQSFSLGDEVGFFSGVEINNTSRANYDRRFRLNHFQHALFQRVIG